MSRMVVWAAGLSLLGLPAAAQGPELLFQAEAQVLAGTCTGQPVRLEGNHNTVTLTGTCGSLLVKGLANTVRLAVVPGGSIRVEGASNRVAFSASGAPPAIVALGPDNEVVAAPGSPTPTPKPVPTPAPAAARQATPPTPAPTPASGPQGPLVLAGDDQQRIQACAGRDVTITGNRSAYLLQGACRSLTLRGDLLAVQAELAPGGRITVTGRGSIVTWVVRGKGHPPATFVRGQGSRAQRAEAS